MKTVHYKFTVNGITFFQGTKVFISQQFGKIINLENNITTYGDQQELLTALKSTY